jgi:hypothetical protein
MSYWFQTKWFLCEFPIGSYAKLSSAEQPSWPEGGTKNLLLRNHWANCNQSLVEWFLHGPLPKLCPVIPTFNQDGRQAKNIKKGDEIKTGATQGPFHQSLVAIGPVVSEEKIKM